MTVALLTLVGLSPYRWVVLTMNTIQTFAITFVVVLLLSERIHKPPRDRGR